MLHGQEIGGRGAFQNMWDIEKCISLIDLSSSSMFQSFVCMLLDVNIQV